MVCVSRTAQHTAVSVFLSLQFAPRVGLQVPLAGHKQAAASGRPALTRLRVRSAVVGAQPRAATPQTNGSVESLTGFLAPQLLIPSP